MPRRKVDDGGWEGRGYSICCICFFFQAEDGIRDVAVTGVQTCALPISLLETLFLLFPANVQKKFQKRDIVFDKISLKAINFVISSLPDLFRKEFVHAYEDRKSVV